MPVTERIVKHLRVRADTAAHVRRTVIQLEDAMRCASLPGADTRLLLVRQLKLGVIAPGASSQTLSRLLEQRFAAAGGNWVHGGSPQAAHAGFVYFQDAFEARVELALRLARNQPCSDWYWPLAVPEYQAEQTASTNLRQIARCIAAQAEAPAALPAWVARLAAAGLAPPLARAIPLSDATMLLQAARVRTVLPSSSSNATHTVTPSGTTRDMYQKRTHVFRGMPEWLRALAGAGGWVESDTLTPEAMGTAIAPGSHAAEQTQTEPAERQTIKTLEQKPLAPAATPDASEGSAIDHVEAHRRADAPTGGCPTRMVPNPATTIIALPTAFGGLLFVLAVLQRLNFAAWADAHADTVGPNVARGVLSLILQRVQAADADPAWLVTRAMRPDDDAGVDTAAAARQWLTASRRWLRRVAGIGIATLVARPALLELTPTHADVYFALDSIDMRVRRAGLDIDPGWIAWYGRVVCFHYIDRPRLIALSNPGAPA